MSEIRIEAENEKGLKGLDVFLGMVCVTFFLDTAAPVASMGPVGISWSLIMALIFYVPSGLIIAELGSTYPDEGGMYAWVKRAYGKRWGARMVWLYWVNNAIWISSLSTFIIGLFTQLFFPQASYLTKIILTLFLIWILIFICLRPIRQSKWVVNIAAIFKLTLVTGLVIAAVIFLNRTGAPSNEFSWDTMRPNFGQCMVFFPALIYNYIGFEVISSLGGKMKNPARDVPRAAIKSAVLVSLLYMVTTAAILIIVPLDQIDLVKGIMDCFILGLPSSLFVTILITIIGCMFLYILVAQSVNWIVAACNMAAQASKDHELPPVFAIPHPKHETPMGTLLISGCIATFLIVFYGFTANTNEDLYWTLFSFTSIICLMPYAINFQAYLQMRKADTTTVRPYRFPGPPVIATVFSRLGQVIIISSIVLFIWVPGTPFVLSESGPLLLGMFVTLGLGEYITSRSVKKAQSLSSSENDLYNSGGESE